MGEGQILQMFSDRLAVTQIVIGGDQVIEQGFRGAGATDLDPLDGQKLLEGDLDRRGVDAHGLHARLAAGIDAPASRGWQTDLARTLQLEQKAAADDLLQMPVGLPPVPLTAKLLGDDRTSSLPVSVHNGLDESDFSGSDSASAVGQRGVHARLYSRLETGTPALFEEISKRQLQNHEEQLPTAKVLRKEMEFLKQGQYQPAYWMA